MVEKTELLERIEGNIKLIQWELEEIAKLRNRINKNSSFSVLDKLADFAQSSFYNAMKLKQGLEILEEIKHD